MNILSVDELRQGHIEDWSRYVREDRPKDVGLVQLSITEYNGVAVRAAIRAGWFPDVPPEQAVETVRNMTHQAVAAAGKKVWELYRAVVDIDPN